MFFHEGAITSVEFSPDGVPIRNLDTPKGMKPERQRAKLDLLGQLNGIHAKSRADNTELEARIRSYELAYQMQTKTPGAVDLSKETAATKRLYGIDQKETAVFGRNCLLARRLVERGVRFVQLYHGAGSKWDAHARIETNHAEHCRWYDTPEFHQNHLLPLTYLSSQIVPKSWFT